MLVTSPAERVTTEVLRQLTPAKAERIAAQLVAGTRAQAIGYNGEPPCLELLPVFLDGDRYRAHLRAAEGVLVTMRRVVERLVASSTLRRRYCVPEWFDVLMGIDDDPLAAPFPTRPDAFVDAHGELRILEINTIPPGDFAGPLDTFGALYGHALPVSGAHLDVTLPRTRATLDALPRHGETLHIGVVGDVASYWVHGAAQRGCESLGVQVTFCAPAEVTVAGGQVHCRGAAVDFVVLGHPIKLGEEFAAHPLIAAARAGVRLPLARGLRSSVLLGRKSSLALLTDDDFLRQLPADEAAHVRAHVPWTRVVRDERVSDDQGSPVALLEHARRGQEHLVLKPTNQQGGSGVVRGWTVTLAQWERALDHALTRPHVLQQRVDPPTRRTLVVRDGSVVEEERCWDFNPFVWQGARAQGVFMRTTRPGELSNLAAGGGIVPCFTVE